MSNIYIQEPPALGKVLLKTSAGEIDIELWTKETPKACRNFIQLCLEGYYNGIIFHRVVPGFIVQGGDPNGDGTGGESIYGEPFKDEFHSRLRFNRRGLVAMANAGKDDNGSQFFITLAATPELQNKHTIFGKVTGETIYNVLKLADGLIGPDDRPEHPHKITSTTVLINPFTDIVPRVTEAQVEEAPKKKKKERQGIKNFGLLSFGEEAEEDEGEAQEYRGKPKSTHDLLEDPKLSKKTAAELELEQDSNMELSNKEDETKKEETAAAVNSIRDKLTSKKRERSSDRDSKRKKEEEEEKESEPEEEYYIGKERDMERQKERDRIRGEIRQLKKEMKGSKEEKDKEQTEKEDKKEKTLEEDNEMYKQFVEEQEKYKKIKEKIPKKGAARNRRTKLERKLPKRKPWVKNLYENREYPDNYTDSKFLEALRKNLHVEKVGLYDAIIGSFRVALRLCICVLYAVLFVYMYNNWINTQTVIYMSSTVTALSYLLYVTVEGSAILRHLQTVLVYIVFGYLLSPILHTLTDTVSTDTIYAWAVIMMGIHLMFFDYDVPAAFVSKSLSINAAIFGSVCLVSRLSTPFDAFILLTVSVLFFVLSPQLFKVYLRTKLFIPLFLITLLLTVVTLYTVSVTLLLYFMAVVCVLCVYCPVMFVKWQKYKDNIHGPWDEAVINDSDDLEECLGSDVRENFTLQLLAKFKSKLHAIKEKNETEVQKEATSSEDVKDDDNFNTDEWLGHKLCFEDKGAVLAKDASTKGDDWFDIYDPRNPINKRKREKTDKKNKK